MGRGRVSLVESEGPCSPENQIMGTHVREHFLHYLGKEISGFCDSQTETILLCHGVMVLGWGCIAVASLLVLSAVRGRQDVMAAPLCVVIHTVGHLISQVVRRLLLTAEPWVTCLLPLSCITRIQPLSSCPVSSRFTYIHIIALPSKPWFSSCSLSFIFSNQNLVCFFFFYAIYAEHPTLLLDFTILIIPLPR